MKRNRIFRRVLALILSVAMAAGLMMGAERPLRVNAAAGDKVIAGLGTDAIANPMQPEDTSSSWMGSYIYFGKYDGEPVKYRVLSKSTGEFGGTTMLLDCDSVLWRGSNPNSQFDDDSNLWAKSRIKTYLNSTFLFGSFYIIEQNAIAWSTKATAGGAEEGKVSFYNYAPLSGEKIFLLDVTEVANVSYGYSNKQGKSLERKKTDRAGSDTYWWLRSDDVDREEMVGVVSYYGHIFGESVHDSTVGVSPALNLDLSSILFSSVISGTAGQTGAEYKLTLLDSSMNIAVEGDITRSGDTIAIPYIIDGASAGRATQVSVLILDQEYTAGNTNGANVLAYEKLNVDSFSTRGTGTFTLPAELSGKAWGTDYFIYLVAEDVNGQKETDYASEPVAIDIQEEKRVSSVQVTLDAPTAGQPFDTTAECSTEGIETVSAVWTDADAQSAGGCAGYNRTYTLSLTITPAEGYILDEAALIQLNDGSRSVENITLNPNDGCLRGTVTFQTAKAKLLHIVQPAPITGVANGTEKTAAAFGLPDTVAIETEDDTVTTAAAEWKMGEITQEEYDPSIQNREQTFTVHGTVILPEQIEHPEEISLEVSVNVTVLAAGVAGTPTANPPGGTYMENQRVTLRSSTQDAEIYYTTEDITPDQANGIPYTGAISVTGRPGESVATTIRAMAVKDGMQSSQVAVFNYTIHLPTLKYVLLVKNGSGSGEYEPGQTVTITADPPAEGKQFKGWKVEKGAISLADSSAVTTTFIMPEEAVSIIAVYENEPDNLNTGKNPDNPNGPDNLDEPDPIVPNSPDNPGNPDNPNSPDNPNGPDNPNSPDVPKNPNTENSYILTGTDESSGTDNSPKTAVTIHETEEETKENSQGENKSRKTGKPMESEEDGKEKTDSNAIIWLLILILILALATGRGFLDEKKRKMNENNKTQSKRKEQDES